MNHESFTLATKSLMGICEEPTQLLRQETHLSPILRRSLKLLFDGATACEPPAVKPLTHLSEIIVDNVDAESIFNELQLRDKPLMKWARGTSATLLEHGDIQLFHVSEIEDEEDEEEDDGDDDEEGEEEEDSDEHIEGSEESGDERDALGNILEEGASSDEGELESQEHIGGVDVAGEENSDFDDDDDGDSLVEDDEPVATDGFFRWNEMERVADDLERSLEFEERSNKASLKRSGRKDDDDDDDDDEEGSDIEYLDDDDDDKDESGILYADFFGDSRASETRTKKQTKKQTENQTEKQAPSKREGDLQAAPDSISEQKNQKVKKRIQELESAALEARPWALAGEVDAKKRPENSLLELDAEWDTVRAAAPEVAVHRTENLEDMIKQRILDERFDSVMPHRPSAQPSTSDDTELSHERSGMGLGEIYEKEYLHTALGVAREDGHSETRKHAHALLVKLSRKIDALSNFSFAPRPAVPDAKITAALPAIAMEEILPMGVANTSTLAPEEAHAKKRGREGLVRSQEELDGEERKRVRGAKKATRRKARRQDEAEAKLASRINPGLGNPYEKRKLVESLRGARNVVTGDQVALETDRKSHMSSARFFDELSGGKKNSAP